MAKKLIEFGETLEEQINKYAEEFELSFVGAVRQLIIQGLNNQNGYDPSKEIDINKLYDQVQKLKENTGWFQADDTQSKLGNLELQIEEMKKKMNVVLKSSKLFKKHIDDRQIHLVDK